ncbi:acetolactate synthase, regulatory subunit [Spiromyces aspiralis]|uniref:Acetolactate synthase, regulatory subunit n=1 Tax=Spiromyces aspiralis TaxID=68401 RepID=A0ACC1HVA5_9FUNG|nr:acetolactate synthase, regulatory subunit [Spiromyces aspiralis]
MLSSRTLVNRRVSAAMARVASLRQYSAKSKVTDSATTGMAFKRSHPSKLRPLPRVPTPTAEQAVSNILYNTPTAPKLKTERHILDCLAQDEPGVLSRVTGIMAARGFNIDSLVASRTEVPGLSRMTIVLKGPAIVMQQAKKQLEDVVPVWAVLDYSHTKIIERESLLVKISILGPEQAFKKLGFEGQSGQEEGETTDRRNSLSLPSRQARLDSEDFGAPFESEHDREFIGSQRRLQALRELTDLFKGRIVDVSAESVVIEMNAKSDRVDAFLKLVRPFGILEAVRSGLMAMPRSAKMSFYEEDEADTDQSYEKTEVDLSTLPPS